MSSSSRSILWRAVAVSLSIHALIFWPVLIGDWMRGPTAVPRLNAVLVRSEPLMRDQAPMLSPIAKTTPDLEAAHVRPARAMPQAESPVMPPTTQRATVLSEAHPANSALSQTRGEVDAGGLRQYRLNIAVVAARVGQLRERVLAAVPQGTYRQLEVRIEIAANGGVSGIEVRRINTRANESTNENVEPQLENAVLSAFMSAVGQASIPASLKGQTFSVSLPIEVVP